MLRFYKPRRIFTFFIILLFWFLLSGNFSLVNLIIGSLVSAVMIMFFLDYLVHKPTEKLGVIDYLKKFIFLLIFAPVLFYLAFAASIQVFKLIFSSEKINPGFVEVKTDASRVSAVSMLANLITLTPGTLTVDFNNENNCYYIHWIKINTHDDQKIRENIIGAFEPWLDRIFG